MSVLLRGELARRGREQRVAVGSGQHPVRLRLEVGYLLVAPDDEGERRGLHAADAQHLLALTAIFQCVEARAVHAEQPVADGPAQSGHVETLILLLFFQLAEALLDGLVGHRRDPQALDGAVDLGHLHHPALDELALLSGITAVDNLVGVVVKAADGVKLFLYAAVGDELQPEAAGNHRQGGERPELPVGLVVVGFLQLTQVTERPGHLVAVALHIAVVRGRSPEDAGYVARDAWFFCYANNHGPMYY